MASMPAHGARASIEALTEIETFLEAAQKVKALTAQLAERRHRASQFDHSLARQITALSAACDARALTNPEVAVMWRLAQREVADMERTILERVGP